MSDRGNGNWSGEGYGTETATDADDETILDKLEELAVLLVLGVGMLALFLGFDRFWVVFAVGFAVFVPFVHVFGELVFEVLGIARREDDVDREAGDPLETLKERYARGEIDEAEFERRLELLVDADDPAEVADRFERRRGPGSGTGADDGVGEGSRNGANAESRDEAAEFES